MAHSICSRGIVTTAGFTVDLPPGRYVLFCDLPGHEAAGMASTITVQ